MKKSYKYLVLLSIGCSFACTDNNENELLCSNDSFVNESTLIRTVDEAVEIANHAVGEFFGDCVSRSEMRSASVSSVKVIYNKTSRASNDTLLYVVNYDNKQGYAIISARQETDPILAVIEYGEINSINEVEGTLMEDFLNQAENFVKSRVESKSRAEVGPITKRKTRTVIDTISYKRVPKKLLTHWGQTNPEGWYCKNGYSGCGPTALAMITAHFGEPYKIEYTFPEKDKDYDYFFWDDIRAYDGSKYQSGYYEHDRNIKEMIGRLCRQIGQDAKANYDSPDGTVMHKNVLVDVLKKYTMILNVSPLQDYSLAGIEAGIEAGLVLMRGDETNSNQFGHIWIADGLIHSVIRTRIYSTTETDPNKWTIWQLDEDVTQTRDYLHFNWGWNQQYDGFFSGEVFIPEYAYKHDYEINTTTGYRFANTQYIVIK